MWRGSFSKASVALGMAQPTISRLIGELEACWQGTLFYRTGRGVELSDLGNKALARSQAIVQEFDQLGDDMRSQQGMPSGQVTLAVVPSLVNVLIPQLTAELHAERPGMQLRILEGFSDQIGRWVSEGMADIGLQARYFVEDSHEKSSSHGSRILLVTSKSSTTLPDRIDLKDLELVQLVLPMQPNALRHCLDAVARQRKLQLNIVAEAVSFMAQMDIAAHCGYGFLVEESLYRLKQMQDGFQSSVICNPSFHRRIVLSTSQGSPLTHAARDVAERLTRRLREMELNFDQT